MKKENKKMAQERRARERARAERNRQLRKGIITVVICAGVAVLVVGIVKTSGSSGSTSSETSSSSVSSVSTSGDTSSSSSSSTELNTDSSLTAEDGDTVNIDFTGTVDGEEFDGGSTNGEGYDLVLGSNSFIDDFEEQIEGHHPGETFDVNVTFPDDYSETSLAGKDAVFETTLNGIYK